MANKRIKDGIARVKEMYPDDDGRSIQLADEVAALAAEYDGYQRMKSEAEEAMAEVQLRLMNLLGTAKEGTVKDWVVTWASYAKRSFVMPAIHGRRFSVRRVGDK